MILLLGSKTLDDDNRGEWLGKQELHPELPFMRAGVSRNGTGQAGLPRNRKHAP